MAHSHTSVPENTVGFAVGTGRCGTRFISQVVALEPDIASVHERNPLNETFHRYCQWYGLPVDEAGYLETKALEIAQDLAHHSFSFEASAYLSLSIQALHSRFGAKFVLLTRSPERVVNSYLRKGWYQDPIVRSDPNAGLGFQPNCQKFHHFLGRIVPSGEEFARWNQLSRVGKLAWYWNRLNLEVLKQFAALPPSHYRVEKLETLTYDRYQELASFLGFQSQLSEAAYQAKTQERPNAGAKVPTVQSWSSVEIAEFEGEVREAADAFEYDSTVANLVNHRQISPSPSAPGRMQWLTDQYQKLMPSSGGGRR